MAGVTMSCNVDVESYQKVLEKLEGKTISRYIRNLIEEDLKDGQQL